MAFPVAVQSAIFYFIACTPCLSARTRYRTKKQFDKERKERAALEMDEPNQYRHPSPFNMNPYWEEEMRMGPSIPKNRRTVRQQIKHREKHQHHLLQTQNSSQRNLTSAGQDSTFSSQIDRGRGRSRGDSSGSMALDGILSEPIADTEDTEAPLRTSGPARSGHNTSASLDRALERNAAATAAAAVQAPPKVHAAPPQSNVSPTLVPEDDTPSMPNTSMSVLEATPSMTVGSDTLSENWNHKLYQREDEELWGADNMSRTHKLRDALAKASSSAGRLIESARQGTKELRMSTQAPLVPGANTVTDMDRANFYAPTLIHPPINDYHPPVVSSKPAHKDGLHWMLQPPPPAKVMEGKVPVSRSTSVASSYAGRKSGSELSLGGVGRKPTAASDVSLTRRKAIEARMRRGDSTNSGATVKRPRASSSTRHASSNSIGGASGARRRSGSLASSVVVDSPAAGAMASSWSDDDAMLRLPQIHDSSAKLETILSSNTSTKENTVTGASQDSGLGLSA